MPLVIHPSSSCDICFESFTGHSDSRPPFGISCGHVFCRDCIRGMNSNICPFCRARFMQSSVVKLIVEASESDDTEEAAIDLLKKLVVSWNIELTERERIELVMEAEQWLENNGTTHKALTKTLEIIRAQNQLKHELEQITATQLSFEEEASAIEQSLSTRLKDAQMQIASLKAEWSVYSRFILDLPNSERDLLAKAFREDGNKAFKSEEFALAVSLYSRAIETSSKHDATFYANRAACYMRMTPQNPLLAVEDCSEAIRHNPIYVKAIICRGIACEALERLDDALNDFFTAASLDLSGITSAPVSVERLLKRLATKKASEIFDNQHLNLPPVAITSAYFANFRNQKELDPPIRLSVGDRILLEAFKALRSAEYQDAMLFVNEALECGISITWRQGRAIARNLRGTFKYLKGDLLAAKIDFHESLSILRDFTQTFVKLAKIHFEQGDVEAGFKCFEDAILCDEDDPDIYHHRGQAYLERKSYAMAADDFMRSIDLDTHFMPSHVQLAIAYFGLKEIRRGENTLKRMCELFPNRSDPLNYFGELYISQRRYPDAIGMFERAFEMEQRKAVANIVPLLNKGRALFQWKRDIESAKDCYMKAFCYNPNTVAATAMISELHLECGDFEEAKSYLEDLVEATQTRSKSELVAALLCQYAYESYQKFLRGYPQLSPQLEVFARKRYLSLARKHLAPLHLTPSILDPTELHLLDHGTASM